MKRYFVLVGLFVALMCSCSNKPSQQDLEKQRQDSIEAAERETAEREAEENKRMEEEGFTTSKGRYSTKGVIGHFYNEGVREGTWDKQNNRSSFGTSSRFKSLWVNAFGMPNNDKAQDVYNRALEEYKRGYQDGLNF